MACCRLLSMRWVLVFTAVHMVAFYAYGQAVDSPLTGLYAGINIFLFVVFALVHRGRSSRSPCSGASRSWVWAT